MKHRLHIANPGLRERAERNANGKEIVSHAVAHGVTSMRFEPVSDVLWIGTVDFANGDYVAVTEADNDDIRVLTGKLMKQAKGVVRETPEPADNGLGDLDDDDLGI